VQVRVYEQAASLGEVGAGLSISPNGALGLKSLGVFDEFRDVAYAPDEQCVRHYKTGARAREGVARRTPRRDCTASAITSCTAPTCIACSPMPCSPTIRRRSSPRTASPICSRTVGRVGALRQRRVEACRGRDRRRRRALARALDLFGAEEVRFTGFVAWRGLVPMEHVPPEALDPPAQVFIGPGHMINRYPVRGGKLLNFVAFAERSAGRTRAGASPRQVAELAEEFKDWHPWVTQIIAAVPEQNLFKWALCARSPLMRWVRGPRRGARRRGASAAALSRAGRGHGDRGCGACSAAPSSRRPTCPRRWRATRAARVGRARFVVERSTLQVPRFHSSDPDSFRHDVPVDEALGLFGYDPAHGAGLRTRSTSRATLAEARLMMDAKGFRHLPVTSHGRLCGHAQRPRPARRSRARPRACGRLATAGP
jgi:salicylate hydroxylase